MSDFFKKLNVLVKASLNELADVESHVRRWQRASGKPGVDVERDVRALRERVDEALAYEDELAARVQALQVELEQWDTAADEAVAAGQDEKARYAVEQVQRVNQRLALAESDLREHRLVTQELIARVNQLEAVVADVRRSEAEAAPESPESSEGLERAGRVVAEVLNDMRQKITEMSEMIGPAVAAGEEAEETEVQPDDAAVADDLARRRERLSKK
jgi:phage shock protein A